VYCDIIIQYKITNYAVPKLMRSFKMSSTCLETEGSSSGRRLYLQLCCIMLYILKLK